MILQLFAAEEKAEMQKTCAASRCDELLAAAEQATLQVLKRAKEMAEAAKANEAPVELEAMMMMMMIIIVIVIVVIFLK